MKFVKIANYILSAFCIAGISACSGDGSDNNPAQTPIPAAVPQINAAVAFSGALTQVNQSTASRYIKNGIYSSIAQYAYQTAVPSAPAENLKGDFSTTNTQEAGIDEADRLEYDGNTLYLAAYAEWVNDAHSPAHVRVLQRNDDYSLSQVAELPIALESGNIDGIYLNNDRLAVLSSEGYRYTFDRLMASSWDTFDNKFSLDLYNTSEVTAPVLLSNMQFDGSLLSSRRIGNALYVISSFTAHVEGLNLNASTDAERLDNYRKIVATSDDELMPKVHVDGQAISLFSAENCAIPTQATEKDGYAQLLSVIKINLLDPNDIVASCISAMAELMYMSADSIYLGATVNDQTALHKVSLATATPGYQASGLIDGVIGWQSQRELKLSEQDGFLRVLTTDYTGASPVHHLSVLNQNGNELKVVASLPNSSQPEPIGKPGEEIYAVRFFGDKAYIVTFERIDPLYVLDLADPYSPKVAGALEIPGFSSYLFPMDNNYLLGVGQQVNTANIPETGSVLAEPVTQEGMKISLFDVNDPANPIEINNIIMAQAYTPVEYDYRALSALNSAGAYQFALPVEEWGQSDEEKGLWWARSSLLLLQVDTNNGQPMLLQNKQVQVPNLTDYYIYGGDDRSVIHGDHVFYIHGNQVWHSLWHDELKPAGPY
jgi:uncharacterized secreted protein with C-terminal beta-propeller domain